MNEPWNIQLFGGLRIRQSERLITRFRTQKTGALLAFLAYHRQHGHGREFLIEMLWPDTTPESGRHNLSHALSSLRNLLEPPGVPAGYVIIADRFAVELNPEAYTTDVAEFEQDIRTATLARNTPEHTPLLMAALERYTGALLPNHYEDWIAPEQERLAQRFQQVAAQLIALLEKAGDLEGALEIVQRAVSLDRLEGAPGGVFSQTAIQIEARLAQSRPLGDLRRDADTSPKSFSYVTNSPTFPTGTVTFLATDLDDSGLIREKSGDAFHSALSSHHALLRREFRRNGGQEVREAGGSFLVVFASVADALACAIACQRSLDTQPWPVEVGLLRVRMALHTGDVESEEGEYHGLILQRAARILAAAHGGQTLCSEATTGLLKRDMDPQVHLKDLGVWRLGNAEEPERLFQAVYPGITIQEFPTLNASPAHSAHLPLQFTRFFGRESEIARIVDLLERPQTRLLTLTGPAGTGKTRLCIEAAGRLSASFAGDIWFVPLADLSDAGLIPQTILHAMGIPLTGSQEPLDQVVAAHTNQSTVLLLDNFEQLVAGGAGIVQILLERVATLQCVVTSRQTLSLPGELELVVAPLSTPGGSDTPERLSLFESVRLFVDRAQAAKPDFRITSSNAPAVAELCDRLEGMPLAIELAAARAMVLTPSQMLIQLGNRFEFLVSRKRGVTERHRTLRAAVDWSYRLLSSDMQRFFAQLCVFRGAWTVEAAEAVCEEPLALDMLAQLRECSLVSTQESNSGIRFRMLETLREYAEGQLSADERALVAARHADFFVAEAEEAEPKLTGPEQGVWLSRLETEHDNLRAALTWLNSAGKGAETGLRLSGALSRFWLVRGHFSEGRERYIAALETEGATERTSERAKALLGAGVLAFNQGDYPAACTIYEESLEIYRELRDKLGIATSLNHLGNVASAQGDYATSRSRYEEGLAIRRELGDKPGIASSLNNLGHVAFVKGDYGRARSLHEESLAIKREIGDKKGIAYSLANLGNVALDQGDYAVAQSQYEESLVTLRELLDKQAIANIVTNLGIVANLQDDYAAARALYQESLEIRRELGDKRGISFSFDGLGNVALDQGDYASARSMYEESLAIRRDLGDKQGVAVSLEGLAKLAMSQQQTKRAAQLYGAADSLRKALGAPLASSDLPEYNTHMSTLRESLGEEFFTVAWEAGRTMTWEQAADYALEESRE